MTLKCGIIGYGYMGKIRHRIINENPNLKLIGIYDIKEIIPEFDCPTPESLIESDIDIIFVCTPNYFSPEFIISALSHGKHVFCEKPPGRNVNDVKNIRGVEEKYPHLKLMFGFNHRYHPAIQNAKKFIENDEILFMKGTYGKSNMQNRRNIKSVSGGGILLDQGIHMLDLFRYFCGDFNNIKFMISKSYWNKNIEDNVFIILSNKNQIATLHSSATLWKHTFMLEVGLKNSYLTVTGLLNQTGSYGQETLTIDYRQSEGQIVPQKKFTYSQDDSWKIEVEKFVDCIKNDKKVKDGSSYDALKAMEIVDKIYKNCNY